MDGWGAVFKTAVACGVGALIGAAFVAPATAMGLGDISAVLAGRGLDGGARSGVAELDIDFGVVQPRLNIETCPPPQVAYGIEGRRLMCTDVEGTTAGYAGQYLSPRGGPNNLSPYGVELPTGGTPPPIGRVAVPAGAYLVSAKVSFFTNDSRHEHAAFCRLSAGTGADRTDAWLGQDPYSYETAVMQTIGTLDADGHVAVTCVSNLPYLMYTDLSITAVSLDSATVTSLPAATGATLEPPPSGGGTSTGGGGGGTPDDPP